MENKGKHTKRHNLEKHKVDLAQRNQEKAQSTKEIGLSTDIVEIQAQPRTHQSKAVARRGLSFGQLTHTALPNVGVKVLARFNVPK